MKLGRIFVLAVIALGIGYYIKYIEIPTKIAEEKKDQIVSSDSDNALSSIEILKGKNSIKLIKKESKNTPAIKDESEALGALSAGKDWVLADLDVPEVDESVVGSLISALASMRLGKPLPLEDVESDLSVYGLSDPALKVIVTSQGGSTKTILFGAKNNFSSLRYAKIDGQNDIYAVTEGVFLAADKDRNEFRDKTPFDFVSNDLKKVTLVGDGIRIGIEPGDTALTWKIVEPVKGTASSVAISELEASLRRVRADGFVDGKDLKPADFGLDNPALQVELEFKDNNSPPLKVSFSGAIKRNDKEEEEASDYFVAVQGKSVIYKLSSDSKPSIFKPLDSFREKRLFNFVASTAKKAEFSGSFGPKLTIEKSGNSWKVNDKEGDAPFIEQFLGGLSMLEASSFPSVMSEFGFGNPTLKVEVLIDSGDPDKLESKVLVVGSKTGSDEYFAAVGDLSEPFIIKEESLKKIEPREESLVKTTNSDKTDAVVTQSDGTSK